MLHHVSDSPGHESLGAFCIKRKTFLKFINYLNDHNYQTITFADIVAEKSILNSSSKKIIITFDDCPCHLFDFAIPEMLKRKMKASFYMPTAHMGQYNSWDFEEGRAKVELMNESDLKELDKLGMEIGGHSHHHIKLKEVKNQVKVKEEVTLCKKIIEEIIQKPVYSFAYPFASVPRNYRRILTVAGYHYGLSIYQPLENKLALRRFGYYDSDTERSLQQKLTTLYKWYRMITDPLKKY